MVVRELSDLLSQKYKQHKDGMLLVAFGELFTSNIKVYAYPALYDNLTRLVTLDNLPIPQGINFLMKFLSENNLIVPIENYNKDILSIIPDNVFLMIQKNEPGWEKFIPPKLATTIKEKKLFGFSPQEIELEI